MKDKLIGITFIILAVCFGLANGCCKLNWWGYFCVLSYLLGILFIVKSNTKN